MEHLQLSTPAAEWLVLDSGLTIAALSPFGFLREGPPRATAPERAAAGRAEIADLDGSLHLLAAPERRVRILVQSPREKDVTLTFFTRGGHGCAFFFDPERFHVGPRKPLAVLTQALARQLRPSPETEGKQVLFWPGVLRIAAALWPGSGLGLDQPRSRAEVLHGLASIGAEGSEPALDELIANGFLERRGDVLALPEAHRPWLEIAMGGHVVQVEAYALEGAGPAEPARLLFAGPAGARVLSRPLEGDALARVLDGAEPAEPRAIHMSALPPDRLETLLRRFLEEGVEATHG